MPEIRELRRTLALVAERWRDPDYEPRAAAVEETLAAPNRFTEEALAFAVNQQMALVTPDALDVWLGDAAESSAYVGVLNAGNVPFAGLQDLLAVLGMGHRYCGVVSSKSPALIPAFIDDVLAERGDIPAEILSYDEMLRTASAVIATGSDETRDAVSQDLDEAGIPAERRLLRGQRVGVAVIDGRETDEDREGLAEDILLHEGLGCRNVAVVWAPRDLSPDSYLDAMAAFRGVFPAHEKTPGSLKMHQAMLAAVEHPHAYGEGLEFLVSKGPPEVQIPGHVRWSEYDDLAEVNAWLESERERLQVVVARSKMQGRISTSAEVVKPGESQRPSIDWRADGIDTVAFLRQLTG